MMEDILDSSQLPAITGLGLVTVLGETVESTWKSLEKGAFISDHTRVPVAIELDDRVTGLARMAAKQAIDQAGWRSSDDTNDAQTAVIVATSKGPIERWIANGTIGPPCQQGELSRYGGWVDTFGLSETAAVLGAEFGVRGPCLTVSAACASGLHALIRAVMLIRAGQAKRVIVVAVESSVHPLFLGSFKRLGVLAPPGYGCRPFDRQRKGFVVSEAAAAVCVETGMGLDSGGFENKRILARIERFGLGGDATHLTGSDPTGNTLGRLLQGVVGSCAVDLVHGHGTGTAMNDAIELAMLDRFVTAQTLPANVYSHKGALGHSLGAAGLISIVLNCVSHQRGKVLPNVRTAEPLAADAVRIAREGLDRPVKRSIAIASGFGGAIAVVGMVSKFC